MTIRGRRIHHPERYLEAVPNGGAFRLITAVTDKVAERAPSLGFDSSVQSGDVILPSIIGPISRYNAEGKWVIHRDRPKELRYIRTIYWSWTDWAGEDYHEFTDLRRNCYQRSLVPPPAVEVTYLE